MNLTFWLAILQIVFSLVGMAFGWITPAEGSGLLLAGLAVFGAKQSQINAAKGVRGVW